MAGSNQAEENVMRTIVLVCLFGAVGLLPAANILTNSSFETWLFGVPLGWLSSELLYPGTAVQDSNSNTGSYCVKLSGADTAAFVGTVAAVTPGRDYGFSGYARVPGALGGSFLLAFFTLQGDTLGLPELLPVYYSDTTYRQYTGWVTAPESAAMIAVSFATLAGLEAYVDDVTLEDTVTGGVADAPGWERTSGLRPRKVLSVAGSQGATSASLPAYDALGRRVAVAARSGVYFPVPGR
jgi:hypothetical protein